MVDVKQQWQDGEVRLSGVLQSLRDGGDRVTHLRGAVQAEKDLPEAFVYP